MVGQVGGKGTVCRVAGSPQLVALLQRNTKLLYCSFFSFLRERRECMQKHFYHTGRSPTKLAGRQYT